MVSPDTFGDSTKGAVLGFPVSLEALARAPPSCGPRERSAPISAHANATAAPPSLSASPHTGMWHIPSFTSVSIRSSNSTEPCMHAPQEEGLSTPPRSQTKSPQRLHIALRPLPSRASTRRRKFYGVCLWRKMHLALIRMLWKRTCPACLRPNADETVCRPFANVPTSVHV